MQQRPLIVGYLDANLPSLILVADSQNVSCAMSLFTVYNESFYLSNVIKGDLAMPIIPMY